MIDVDSIITQQNNKENIINIVHLNDFDSNIPIYNLDDEKDLARYLKDACRICRQSYEYKIFIKYLRENFGMDKCAFLNNVSNSEDFSIAIELHHYPLTLYDIASIIYKKRLYNNESLSVFMLVEEILQCHYQLLVGLIPLSETVHELFHSGRLFIPVNKVMGRYRLFIDIYYPFIDPEILDNIKRIERATDENSEVGDTTILNTNLVRYNVTDKRYQLPTIKQISDDMINRVEMIKNNNYILPTINDVRLIEEHQEQEKKLHCPIKIKNQ